MNKHRVLCAIICCVCILISGCSLQSHQDPTLGSTDVADEEVILQPIQRMQRILMPSIK